jgi:hypothetical protein
MTVLEWDGKGVGFGPPSSLGLVVFLLLIFVLT